MKKFLMLALAFLFILGGLSAQQNEAWEYPVKPGTEEWRQLKNHKQKVNACQIPKGVLSQMKTEDLIEACLNYPLLRDIMAFNYLQNGIDKLKVNFNGFNELLVREDAAKLLFSKYKRIKPDEFNKSWSLIKKGDYAFDIMSHEVLLSQRELLNTLNKNEKKELVKELLKKFEEKNDPEVYGRLSQMTIGLCMIRVLEQEESITNIPIEVTTNDLMLFSEKANLQNVEILPSIILLAEDFIK